MKQRTRLPTLLLAAIALLVFSCTQQQKNNHTIPSGSSTGEQDTQQQQKAPDESLLVGEWVRTDAPYRIQIAELFDDGRMIAGYFNPQSINVNSADWVYHEGTLKTYIELRDDNYPGSNYNLMYVPERDVLAGEYFQAVEGVTFDVEFVGMKTPETHEYLGGFGLWPAILLHSALAGWCTAYLPFRHQD